MSAAFHAIAATLLLALAAPAIARDADSGAITTSVRVKRIAIRSPADRRRLDRLIGDAALEACGGSDGDLAERSRAIRHSPCYARAIAGAAGGAATAVAMSPDTQGRP
jgi:UrcA family protein